jgi:hypothetical protein
MPQQNSVQKSVASKTVGAVCGSSNHDLFNFAEAYLNVSHRSHCVVCFRRMENFPRIVVAAKLCRADGHVLISVDFKASF